LVPSIGDDLVGGAAYRHVSIRNAASTSLDLLYLLIAQLPAFFSEIFVVLGVVAPRGGREAPRFHVQDVGDLEFQVGTLGQISGSGGGQFGLFRTVRRQKDLAREYAHLLLSSLAWLGLSHYDPRKNATA
jgi:hypothetical protein